jgi:hypothetical protein
MIKLQGRERPSSLNVPTLKPHHSQTGKPSPTPTRVQIISKNLLMRREETHFLLDLEEMTKMPNL